MQWRPMPKRVKTALYVVFDRSTLRPRTTQAIIREVGSFVRTQLFDAYGTELAKISNDLTLSPSYGTRKTASQPVIEIKLVLAKEVFAAIEPQYLPELLSRTTDIVATLLPSGLGANYDELISVMLCCIRCSKQLTYIDDDGVYKCFPCKTTYGALPAEEKA